MKSAKHHLLRNTLIAAASGFLAISSASAVIVSTPNSGDIFLAFRASGGQGASISYLVNLGQASQFTSAAENSSFTLSSIGNIGADLTATFGSLWHERSDLYWGIIGTTDSTNPTLYASKERTGPSVATTPWNTLTQTARAGTKTEILSVTSGVNGFNGRESTANSPVAVLQPNTATSSSYNYQVTGGATDFGSLSQWSTIEGNFADGAAGTVLDLYRLRQNSPTVSNLGNFTIDPTGAVTFSAIPEPSIALLAVTGGVVFTTRRRRAASH